MPIDACTLESSGPNYIKAVNFSLTEIMRDWKTDREMLVHMILMLLLRIHQPKEETSIIELRFHLNALGFEGSVVEALIYLARMR